MTTTYTNRSNAGRAARKALEAEGVKAPLSMVHFTITEPAPGEFGWERIAQEPAPKTVTIAHGEQVVLDKATLAKVASPDPAKLVARGALMQPEEDTPAAKAFANQRSTHAFPAEIAAADLARLQSQSAKPLPPVQQLPARAAAGVAPPRPTKDGTVLKAAGALDAVLDAQDPLVVDGIRHPTKAKADAARKAAADRLAAKRERARAPGGHKAPGLKAQKTAEAEAAANGVLPQPPKFESATAKTYQKRLDPIIAAAAAGNIPALRQQTVDANCKDSRVAAMGRYRDLCIIALQAQAKA